MDAEVLIKPGRAEMFETDREAELMGFLDKNGYSGREVRAIAKRAIALWETQKTQDN